VSEFAKKVDDIVGNIYKMLVAKNKKYGNSALKPIRVFSKSSNVEQLLVRIDDKLSRLSNQNAGEDEDVIDDLIGYLILLKIAHTEDDGKCKNCGREKFEEVDEFVEACSHCGYIKE